MYSTLIKKDSSISIFSEHKFAWIVLITFVLLSVLLVMLGAGKIMNFFFPAGGLIVGLIFYLRAPLIYISFNCWLWLLCPLIRRISDYRGGFTDPSPILLTPILVSLIAGLAITKGLLRVPPKYRLPYILVLAGIVYGLSVGLIYRPTSIVLLKSSEWFAPVLFSFYLVVNWRKYLQYREIILQTFAWAALVMGIYGIFQYTTAPEWDKFWMIKTQMDTIGSPRPFEIRVWSTSYSPRPFGTMMMSCLIMLTLYKSKINLPATISGYLSLLLCTNRASWGSWLVAIVLLWNSLKAKYQIKIISAVILLAPFIFSVANYSDLFSENIRRRFATFSDLENDGSGQKRLASFGELIVPALKSFFGEGIGDKSYDNGILAMLFNFGWFGSSFYMGGLIALLWLVWSNKHILFDPFLAASRAIATAVLAQFPLGGTTNSAQGTILWIFLGISIAGVLFCQSK
jgi:hypothetical protein